MPTKITILLTEEMSNQPSKKLITSSPTTNPTMSPAIVFPMPAIPTSGPMFKSIESPASSPVKLVDSRTENPTSSPTNSTKISPTASPTLNSKIVQLKHLQKCQLLSQL